MNYKKKKTADKSLKCILQGRGTTTLQTLLTLSFGCHQARDVAGSE